MDGRTVKIPPPKRKASQGAKVLRGFSRLSKQTPKGKMEKTLEETAKL